MLFVKFSQFIIALSYCRLNKLPLEHSWSTAQVSVFVFFMWSLSIYTRTLPRTLCNFPNSLIKSNRSLAVTLSLFSLLSVSFLRLALENVVCKRVTLLSINLVFSIQSRISWIVFYRLALSCFSNPIVQKNKKILSFDTNLECFSNAFLLYLLYPYSRLWTDIMRFYY